MTINKITQTILLIAGIVVCLFLPTAALGFVLMSAGIIMLMINKKKQNKTK
ncbi:MAG: hypothetical protein FWG69_04425 [Oscillospiraceae bacterium]|nr:hypothetical protein [Oscillospiraceae bacterium]